jgi:YD repeat-containing protein
MLGFAVLIQGCDDEKVCGAYRLNIQVDVQNTDGGNATFIYNTDGSLQKVSGRYHRDDNFFYDANGRLIRTETGNEPGVKWLFRYDAKGRVLSMHQDTAYTDSMVFVYDDNDRMIKSLFYRDNPEIFYYYDIKYPDAATVEKSVYYRDPDTKEFQLSYIDTYTLDNHPRPHPQEYYLYQFPIEEVFLPHNPLSIHSTYGGGKVIKKSFTYNAVGYPVSEDDVFMYMYSCE